MNVKDFVGPEVGPDTVVGPLADTIAIAALASPLALTSKSEMLWMNTAA
jgi:hypothetical protein